MIKAIAFDFDGVILESVGVKDEAIYELFEDAGPEERSRVLDLHRKTPGINRQDRMELLLTRGLGRQASQDIIAMLQERFARLVWDGIMKCPEVSGVRNFLEFMNKKGIPCYVVSAAPQQEVKSMAEARNLSGYFKDIFGAPENKTKLLKNIADREEIKPKHILFIGDKISDYQAAKKANTQFLGRKDHNNPTVYPEEVKTINDFTPNPLEI